MTINKEYLLERSQVVPVSRAEAFAFFSDAHNLEAITPPWLRFVIESCPPQIGRGALIDYRLRLHGFPVRWRTRIEVWLPTSEFVDFQVRGPYHLWRHQHTFEDAPGGTCIRDRVQYALPLGILGRLAHFLFVRRDLEAIFDYRTRRIRELLPSVHSDRSW